MQALIGHSGFVGETLKRATRFDAQFRSTDIETIEGRSFDLVVCAGAPAAKWLANREPERDRANLERLQLHLGRVHARRFLLVSTVDVYPDPSGVDEAMPAGGGASSAYGAHRLQLECFCRDRFDAVVVRLPALFGPGLRKNAVYDLLHGNQVERLQPLSTYQFYDVSLLWSDMLRVEGAGLKLANLATEPISLAEVAGEAFGRRLPPNPTDPVVAYDFRTRHGALWGRSDGYAYGATEMLDRLRSFVRAERSAGGIA